MRNILINIILIFINNYFIYIFLFYLTIKAKFESPPFSYRN